MYSQFIPQKKSKSKPPAYENTAQPWDQLPDESDAAYAAFVTYRHIGYSRTLPKVADRIYGEHGTKHLHVIEEWSQVFNWDKRAGLYDGHIREHETEIKDEHIRKAQMQMAEALGHITDTSIDIALGRKQANKDQVKMITDIYDRAGPSKTKAQENTTNILNQIEIRSPELPHEVQDQYKADEADFEEIENEADNLIPDHLKEKRNFGK